MRVFETAPLVRSVIAFHHLDSPPHHQRAVVNPAP